MIDNDRVDVTAVVAVDPDTAFRVFTDEIDLWWRQGYRFRAGGDRPIRLEPGVGGRVYWEDKGGGAPFEIGRVRIWEPGKQLAFSWRNLNMTDDESTDVDIRFEAEGDGTRVTLVSSGWGALADDHPSRHGLDADSFGAMMGLWWADQLNALRRRLD